MRNDDYIRFIESKHVRVEPAGFEAGNLSPHLFDYQKHSVAFALRLGRAALFLGTGLGKTACQVEWARCVAEHTGGRVLILAPLAVAQQTVREGERFGVKIRYVREHADIGDALIAITNYERLDKFDLSSLSGVVLDESGILKSFMGKTKRSLVERCASIPYRLCCTATPAPNDHMELGNHAEFLGVMRANEMLTRWFINDTSCFGTYRLKGHAVKPFWDWVASWAVCIDRPDDLGFDGSRHVLPELKLIEHIVEADVTLDTGGKLFREAETSATSIHREKRMSVADRAAKIAELVAAEPEESWMIWCDTDYEADELKRVIPDVVEIRGSHKPEVKEQAALDFVDGKVKRLISKSSIFGWGLNFQQCSRTAFIGVNYSYESFYQAVRRFWRFGQTKPVHAHVVMSSTERNVWSVVSRKSDAHDEMRAQMSAAMRRMHGKASPTLRYCADKPMRLPTWLKSEGE